MKEWKELGKQIKDALLTNNKRWVPASIDGVYVKSRVRMPLIICIEED